MQTRHRSFALCASLMLASSCALDREPAHLFPQKNGGVSSSGGAGASLAGEGGGQAGSGASGTSGLSAGAGGVGGIGVGAAGSSAGTGMVVPPKGGCEPTGIFAAQASVDVAWGGRSTGLAYLTDNGRGRITVQLHIEIEHVNPDGSFTASAKPCHVELPPFYSTIVCEVYQPVFPHKVWDSAAMPSFPVDGRYSCMKPGCSLEFDLATALIGVDLKTPDAAWPTAAQTYGLQCAAGTGPACFNDHDGDKFPGITLEMRAQGASPPNEFCPNSYPFRPPPLSSAPQAIFNGVERAQTIHLGTRTRLGGTAVLDQTCAQGQGKGVAQGFESRAIGCGIQVGSQNWPGPPAVAGEYCDAAQEQFMDENLPIYFVLGEGQLPDAALQLPDPSASKGTLFSIVRLGNAGDPISCSQVRAAY